jgi:hypothetical protein
MVCDGCACVVVVMRNIISHHFHWNDNLVKCVTGFSKWHGR